MFQTETEREREGEKEREREWQRGRENTLWLIQSEILVHKVKAMFTLLLLSMQLGKKPRILPYAFPFIIGHAMSVKQQFVYSYDDDKQLKEFSPDGGIQNQKKSIASIAPM